MAKFGELKIKDKHGRIKTYVPAVFLINTKDEHKRPKLLTILHEEQTINLAGGEEFMIGYLPKHMIRKRSV